MSAGRAFLGLCLALLACDASAQAGDPVQVTLKHFEALYAHRCADVWASFSKGTQENIRAQVRRKERERAGAPTGAKPEEAHCGKSGRVKRGSARLVEEKGDRAVVSVVILDRVSRYRYDLFPPESELPEQVNLVREEGAWKVDLPRVPVEPARKQLVEVGDVDVFVDSRVPAGLHGRYEATAVVRAPRTAFEKLLRDPSAWATVLPSFKAIETLEPAGDRQRVRLSLQDPAPPVVYVLTVSPPPTDPGSGNTTLQWNPEEGTKAPAYLRGRWDIHPNPDGTTRVKLTFVMDPRHWPEGHFSAERLGNAVRDLGKAAQQVR